MRAKYAVALIAGFLAFVPLATMPAVAKTAKECSAEYAANKAQIKAAKQKKADYIAACKAEAEGAPPAAPLPAATPAAAPTSAPAPSPTPSVAARPRPAPTRAATPTGAGGYSSEQEAKIHCPMDTVVWVNTSSGVYHFAGTHNYGTTKAGDYMCEADAKAANDRAAKNEKHP